MALYACGPGAGKPAGVLLFADPSPPVDIRGFFMERYYLKVQGQQGPVVAHDTLEEAYIEARRLSGLLAGMRRVYVLQVIGTIEPTAEQPHSKRNKGAPARVEG